MDQSNAIGHCPSSRSWPQDRSAAMRGAICSGSITSGRSPIRPMITALSVPCPTPVADSEPYRRTSTRHTRSSIWRSRKASTKSAPASIGPTVWELEGPMPILKRSNTLIATLNAPLEALKTGAIMVVLRTHRSLAPTWSCPIPSGCPVYDQPVLPGATAIQGAISQAATTLDAHERGSTATATNRSLITRALATDKRRAAPLAAI